MTTAHRRAVSARSKLGLLGRRSSSSNSIDQTCLIGERVRFLRSFDAKFTYLARCQRDVSDEGLIERQAAKLDLCRASTDIIRYVEVPRLGRSPRRICQFSLRDRVALKMAKDMIEAQFRPKPHLYSWKGRGNALLITDLVASLDNAHSWVLLADVRDCFDSINFDAVYDLGILPETFVRANMDARTRRFQRKACQHLVGNERRKTDVICPLCAYDREPVVWRGLMQGSAASSALLAMLFDDLPSHLPNGLQAFVSADNIAIVASTREACREAQSALDCYMSNHRAGPLSLTTEYLGPARPGFEHLGYAIRWTGGRWSIRHSSPNLFRSVRRLVRREGEGIVVDLGDCLHEVLSGFPALSGDAVAALVDFAIEAPGD